MSSEITTTTNRSFDLMEFAQAAVQSKLLRDVMSIEDAIVKIQTGLEWGMGPMQSLQNVIVIEGTPAMKAAAIGAAIKKSPKYDYRVTEHTDQSCTILFVQNGEALEPAEVFTLADAKRAGLDHKQNWRKYPKAMLFSRCLTAGGRKHCPDVFGLPIYTPEEIEPTEPATAVGGSSDSPPVPKIDKDKPSVFGIATTVQEPVSQFPAPEDDKADEPLSQSREDVDDPDRNLKEFFLDTVVNSCDLRVPGSGEEGAKRAAAEYCREKEIPKISGHASIEMRREFVDAVNKGFYDEFLRVDEDTQVVPKKATKKKRMSKKQLAELAKVGIEKDILPPKENWTGDEVINLWRERARCSPEVATEACNLFSAFTFEGKLIAELSGTLLRVVAGSITAGNADTAKWTAVAANEIERLTEDQRPG
mgnify:CR=1 FL=1